MCIHIHEVCALFHIDLCVTSLVFSSLSLVPDTSESICPRWTLAPWTLTALRLWNSRPPWYLMKFSKSLCIQACWCWSHFSCMCVRWLSCCRRNCWYVLPYSLHSHHFLIFTALSFLSFCSICLNLCPTPSFLLFYCLPAFYCHLFFHFTESFASFLPFFFLSFICTPCPCTCLFFLYLWPFNFSLSFSPPPFLLWCVAQKLS